MIDRDGRDPIHEIANGAPDLQEGEPAIAIHDAFADCLALGVGNPEGGRWVEKKFGAIQNLQATTIQSLKKGRNSFNRERTIATFKAFAAHPIETHSRLKQTEFRSLSRLFDAISRENPDWDLVVVREMLDAVEPLLQAPLAASTPPKRLSEDLRQDWPGPIALITLPFAILFVFAVGDALRLWTAAFGILVFSFAWFYEAALATPARRRRLASAVRKNAYISGYRRAVLQLIKSFDAICSPNAARRVLPTTSAVGSWTLGLYSRCLIIAVLYPIPIMLAQWTFLGESVLLGDRILLAVENAPVIGRTLATFSYVASLACLCVPALSRQSRRRLWLLAAALWALVGFYLLGVLLGPSGPIDPLTVHFMTAIAFSGSLLAVTLVLAFRSMDVSIAIVLAMTLAGLVGAVVDRPFDEAAQRLSEVTGIQKDIAGQLVAQFVQWSLTIGLSWQLIKLARKGIGNTDATVPLLYLLMVAATVIAIGLGAGYVEDPIFYILMGLIPIANSVFDFASTGLTRWALARGVRRVGRRTIAFGLLDLVAAISLFLGLGCSLILIFHLANFMSIEFGDGADRTILELDAASPSNFITLISLKPSGHIWLLLVYATTLLPTVVHLFVAVWTIGPAQLPRARRHALADGIASSSKASFDLLGTIASLSLWSAVAALAPFVAAYALLKLFEATPDVAASLVAFFAWFNAAVA